MDLKSNEPFWLIKNGLIESYPSLRDDETCDVLIVGGGITGSLLAHQSIHDGYETVLIDKREVCNGSTSATTSMLQYEIDTPLHRLIGLIGEEGARASYQACASAIDKLSELGENDGFSFKKSLYYASRKKDLAWLRQEFLTRKAAGYEVKWLEPDEIQDRYDFRKTHGGILSEKGGSVDAFRLAHGLLAKNKRRGLRIYDKTELTKVVYGSRFNTCLTAGGARIKAKKTIYCTGYESRQMIPEKFVNLLSSFAVVSEINETLFKKYKDLLIWNTDEPYLYMRTTDDGRFLIGGKDEPFQDPQKRDALIAEKETALLKALKRLLPGCPFISDFAWAGTFGETKDGLPYIGEHPKFKNSYFVLGFGGNGITFSVTGMEMASHWLNKRKHPLAPYFAFGR